MNGHHTNSDSSEVGECRRRAKVRLLRVVHQDFSDSAREERLFLQSTSPHDFPRTLVPIDLQKHVEECCSLAV
jgi:hypothetical protein